MEDQVITSKEGAIGQLTPMRKEPVGISTACQTLEPAAAPDFHPD